MSTALKASKGLKLCHIHDFVENVCGGRKALEGMTTLQVKNDFIIPHTEKNHCSYSSMVTAKHPDLLTNEAVIIVCHALEESFLDLVDSLNQYFEDDASTASELILWIDVFCFNYHALHEVCDLQGGNSWTDLVDFVSRKYGNTIVVLSPWNSRRIFQSPFCMYQIYKAVKEGFLLEVTMSASEKANFFQTIFRQPDDVKQVFSQPLLITEEHFAYEDVHVPQYFYKYFLRTFLGSVEEENKFYETIQLGMKIWISHFIKEMSLKMPNTDSTNNSHNSTPKNQYNYMGTPTNSTGGKTPSMENWREEERTLIRQLEDETNRITSSVALRRRTTPSIKEEEFEDQEDSECDTSTVNLISSSKKDKIAIDRREDYSKVIDTLQGLISLYLHKNMYQQAESNLLKLLEIQQNLYGLSHVDTLTTTLKFAKLCVIMKKVAMAEVFYISYMENMQDCKEMSDREKLLVMQNVANFYHAQGNYEKALPIYEQCLTYTNKIHGPSHHLTLHTTSMLANISMHLGKVQDASNLSRSCIEIAKSIHGEGHDIVQQYKAHHNRIMEGVRMSSALQELDTLAEKSINQKLSISQDQMSFTTHSRSLRTPGNGETEFQNSVKSSYPLIATSSTEDELDYKNIGINKKESNKRSPQINRDQDASAVCIVC